MALELASSLVYCSCTEFLIKVLLFYLYNARVSSIEVLGMELWVLNPESSQAGMTVLESCTINQ